MQGLEESSCLKNPGVEPDFSERRNVPFTKVGPKRSSARLSRSALWRLIAEIWGLSDGTPSASARRIAMVSPVMSNHVPERKSKS